MEFIVNKKPDLSGRVMYQVKKYLPYSTSLIREGSKRALLRKVSWLVRKTDLQLRYSAGLEPASTFTP